VLPLFVAVADKVTRWFCASTEIKSFSAGDFASSF
jgi:hypothetical protein